ncbi:MULTISPECIES: hypothetical protein [Pseudomonas]|jgi:hypothetical protein|uniref:hypothetical protein n=1 Tax=Pseudomonas TaxID=286 RepID=UPI0007619F2E|nr:MULTISPECIES: hypothetical protein [Pseudomonas]EKT4494610.1 hypothetical protein [Pseudomonas putida]EKT8865593.1 hypothetical protein [Pseudomonas putida]MCE0903645.1 hypothetical protein [Pseudomonas alloputida]
MFVSDSWAEVKGLAALLEPGQRGWHLMLKPQMSPWFHATLVRHVEGFETRTVVFIDSLSALIPWVEMGVEGMMLESLQLVSPAWLSGSDAWAMDLLVEVAQSVPDGAVRFTLQDGRVFYYPDPTPKSKHHYTRMIYLAES